jgi:hypothetical protein
MNIMENVVHLFDLTSSSMNVCKQTCYLSFLSTLSPSTAPLNDVSRDVCWNTRSELLAWAEVLAGPARISEINPGEIYF